MQGRRERLLQLLQHEFNSLVRKSAASQLGSLVDSHPNQVVDVLDECCRLLFSKSWDSRIAAGLAIEEVVGSAVRNGQLKFHCESKDAESGDEGSYLLCKRDLKSEWEVGRVVAHAHTHPLIGDTDDFADSTSDQTQCTRVWNTLFGSEDSLDCLLRAQKKDDPDGCASCIGSDPSIYPVIRQTSGVKVNHPNELLTLFILSRMGLITEGTSDSDRFEHLLDSLIDRSNQCQSDDHSINKHRKRKLSAMQSETESLSRSVYSKRKKEPSEKDDDLAPLMHVDFHRRSADRSVAHRGCSSQNDGDLDLVFYVRLFCVRMIDHRWDLRHGSLIGLRSLLAQCAKIDRKVIPTLMWEQCAILCLSVAILDEFADFTDETPIMPVKETAVQAFTLCLSYLLQSVDHRSFVVSLLNDITVVLLDDTNNEQILISMLLVLRYSLPVLITRMENDSSLISDDRMIRIRNDIQRAVLDCLSTRSLNDDSDENNVFIAATKVILVSEVKNFALITLVSSAKESLKKRLNDDHHGSILTNATLEALNDLWSAILSHPKSQRSSVAGKSIPFEDLYQILLRSLRMDRSLSESRLHSRTQCARTLLAVLKSTTQSGSVSYLDSLDDQNREELFIAVFTQCIHLEYLKFTDNMTVESDGPLFTHFSECYSSLWTLWCVLCESNIRQDSSLPMEKLTECQTRIVRGCLSVLFERCEFKIDHQRKQDSQSQMAMIHVVWPVIDLGVRLFASLFRSSSFISASEEWTALIMDLMQCPIDASSDESTQQSTSLCIWKRILALWLAQECKVEHPLLDRMLCQIESSMNNDSILDASDLLFFKSELNQKCKVLIQWFQKQNDQDRFNPIKEFFRAGRTTLSRHMIIVSSKFTEWKQSYDSAHQSDDTAEDEYYEESLVERERLWESYVETLLKITQMVEQSKNTIIDCISQVKCTLGLCKDECESKSNTAILVDSLFSHYCNPFLKYRSALALTFQTDGCYYQLIEKLCKLNLTLIPDHMDEQIKYNRIQSGIEMFVIQLKKDPNIDELNRFVDGMLQLFSEKTSNCQSHSSEINESEVVSILQMIGVMIDVIESDKLFDCGDSVMSLYHTCDSSSTVKQCCSSVLTKLFEIDASKTLKIVLSVSSDLKFTLEMIHRFVNAVKHWSVACPMFSNEVRITHSLTVRQSRMNDLKCREEMIRRSVNEYPRLLNYLVSAVDRDTAASANQCLSLMIPFIPRLLRIQMKTPESPPTWMSDMLIVYDPRQRKKKYPPISVNSGIEIRHYQMDGIRWVCSLCRLGMNGIIADDMGLGKTLEALAAIHQSLSQMKITQHTHSPSLVVCPNSVIWHWKSEIDKFFGKVSPRMVGEVIDASNLASLSTSVSDGCHRIFILSYDTLIQSKIASHIARVLPNLDYCILDEGHLIKDSRSKESKACKSIGKLARHRLILSGTPIEENVLDLWSLLDFLMPGYLGVNREWFEEEFGSTILKSYAKKATLKEKWLGSQAMSRLKRVVSPFIMRRMKNDVLTELPPKTIQDVMVELKGSQRMRYESEFKSSDHFQRLKEITADDHRTLECSDHNSLSTLSHFLIHPSLVSSELLDVRVSESAKLSGLKGLLDQIFGFDGKVHSKHRVVIFSHYMRILRVIQHSLLRQHFPGLGFLIIDDHHKQPHQSHSSSMVLSTAVQTFNEDDSISVLLLTVAAGGLGINLSAADIVIFVDHSLNAMVDLQAMDRAHRIGQQQNVQVFRVMVKDTLEERLFSVERFTRQINQSAVDAGLDGGSEWLRDSDVSSEQSMLLEEHNEQVLSALDLRSSEMTGKDTGLDVLGELECEHANPADLLATLAQDSLVSMVTHSRQYRSDLDTRRFLAHIQ